LTKIYFSKNLDIFNLKCDEELHSFFSARLQSHQFKKIDKLLWQKISFDDIDLIESVYNIFSNNTFQIIPDEEIKNIQTKIQQQREEYDKFSTLGLEIKKNKIPNLPKVDFKNDIHLLPFQKMPIKHMITIPNSANFSIPGAGKTLMTLTAFQILKNQNIVDQIWVIGPIASFKAWEDEYENLFQKPKNISVLRYHASTPEKRDSLRNKIKKRDLIVTSYNTAANDLELIKHEWRLNSKKIFLVLDESHHIKSIEEITKNGNDTMSQSMINLGKFAERRCILTGTPIPRNLDDLWSQITFLWPTIEPLGKRTDFLEWFEDFDAEDRLKSIIDFMWTRVTNVELQSEMPARFFHPIQVEMDSTQQQIYRIIESQILHEMPEGDDKETTKQLKKARIIRLLQTVTDPKLIMEKDSEFNKDGFVVNTNSDKSIRELILESTQNESTPKIKKVAKDAQELINQKIPKNVLIFTTFKGTAKTLAKELRDVQPLVVTGDDPAEKREITYEEFKNWDFSNGKGKILIATTGSIAESVSLHKNKDGKPVCQTVLYLERNYNGGQYMQSLYRVYRIGSEKKLPINYYFYESIFPGKHTTIDRIINDILEIRTRRMFDILDDKFITTPISLGIDDEDTSVEDEKDDNEFDEIESTLFEKLKKDAKNR
jgi:hypothetical protein